MIRLILTVEDEAGRRYAFAAKESPVLIGSSVLSDLRLVHPQMALLHARVTFDEMNATLEDLDSRTGCTKNGRRLSANKPEGILDDAPVVLGGVFRLESSWGEIDDDRPERNPFGVGPSADRDGDVAALSPVALAARAERLRGQQHGNGNGNGAKGRIAYGSGPAAADKPSTGGKTLFMTGPAPADAGGKTLLHMPSAPAATSVATSAGAARSVAPVAASPLPTASAAATASVATRSSAGSPSLGAPAKSALGTALPNSDSDAGGGTQFAPGARGGGPAAPGLTPSSRGQVPRSAASVSPASAGAASASPASASLASSRGGSPSLDWPSSSPPLPSSAPVSSMAPGGGRDTPAWAGAAAALTRERGTPAYLSKASPSPPASSSAASSLGIGATTPAAGSASGVGQGTLPGRLPETVLALPAAADLAASLPSGTEPRRSLPTTAEPVEARTLLEVPSPFIVRTAPAVVSPSTAAGSALAGAATTGPTATSSVGASLFGTPAPSFEPEAPRGGPRATRIGRVAWATDALGSRTEGQGSAAPVERASPFVAAKPSWSETLGAHAPAVAPSSSAREDGRDGSSRAGSERSAASAPQRAGAEGASASAASERAASERGPADLSVLREKVQPLARRPAPGSRRVGRVAHKHTILLAVLFFATLIIVLGVGAWFVLRPSEEPLAPEGASAPAMPASAAPVPPPRL